MAGEPFLQVVDLTVEYPTSQGGWRTVVDGFSLDLDIGERVGLVGESGSGKSVAALAILGLVGGGGRIRSGTIAVGGESLPGAQPDRIRRLRGSDIGLVFQESMASLNPVYTVGFQLMETIHCHRRLNRADGRAQAEQLLSSVGLTDTRHVWRAYPHQLSGGQLQRIAVALALAGRPRIVIADEPTTHLDTIHQGEILGLLRRLSEQDGTGLLLISHDLAVVAGMVDRVIVMFAGQVVEEAPAADLFAMPIHPFSRLLIDSGQGPDGSLATIHGRRRPTIGGCRFAPRCPFAETRCHEVPPTLVEVGPRRRVRCPILIERTSSPSRGPGTADG
jgi:oligopeptide/dipeptide ABC transporter ATP-binding protein